MGERRTVLISTREVSGSNLDRNISFPEILRALPQYILMNTRSATSEGHFLRNTVEFIIRQSLQRR